MSDEDELRLTPAEVAQVEGALDRARLRALVRLLVDSGDMTPMGARQVGLVLDEMTEDA